MPRRPVCCPRATRITLSQQETRCSSVALRCPFHIPNCHQHPNPNRSRLGFFLARNASIGAVPRRCLASGTPEILPSSARRGPLSSPFSLVASRAVARAPLVFTRGCVWSVVVEDCCSHRDRRRIRGKNPLLIPIGRWRCQQSAAQSRHSGTSNEWTLALPKRSPARWC